MLVITQMYSLIIADRDALVSFDSKEFVFRRNARERLYPRAGELMLSRLEGLVVHENCDLMLFVLVCHGRPRFLQLKR